jgi:hypothetical protein
MASPMPDAPPVMTMSLSVRARSMGYGSGLAKKILTPR